MASDASMLLEQLHISSQNNEDNLGQQFEELINNIHKEGDTSSICKEIVKNKILSLINKTLQNGNTDAQTKAAELVAELAKVESCRVACVEEGIVPILVEKMSSTQTATALQACRALGNICYEHDGGRMCVMNAGGSTQLLKLLKCAADLSDTPENHQLRLVATGFLLNLLNSYDTTEQEHPVDALLVDVLCHYLDKFVTDEDIPTHILLSMSCMAESDVTRGLLVSKDITPQLVKVLSTNKSDEVVETCLELITNLAESECVKTQFAVGGICEAVLGVINRHKENPLPDLSPPIIKTATDLLVLILVGDESMNVVYGNGEGRVYLELVSWLSCSMEDLQIAGALAMGNFARNDDHCSNMVRSGIVGKLLQVLGGHNSPDGDIRLQHALLSALRNLSIAKKNKPFIVQQGALDTLLPMVCSIETYPVVFKLLATIRMIIDGQAEAAIKVGESEKCIQRIVSWCNTQEHPGVQGEASRILAWIVKNCDGNDGVINSLLKTGALPPLIIMLASEHAVMVNEAALALALIFAKGNHDSFMSILSECSFVQSTISVLRNQSLPPEVISNVLASLVALSSSEEFTKLANTADMISALDSYSTHSNEDIKSTAKKLQDLINS